MKRVDFDIELLSDVSVPESNRSQGGARSLDFVPGRALWGAVASALFRCGLDDSEGLALFRGRRLRFLDAVPSANGQRTFPTPLSWQQEKYGTGAVLNLVDDDARASVGGTQYERLKGSWRTPSGAVVHLTHRQSLRTAVGPSGRAEPHLLFGIDALPAGIMLHGRVLGDHELVERVGAVLFAEPLLLGRSRSAEFGLVRCTPASRESHGLTLAKGRRHRVSFLCCSRLALRDPATGAPDFRFRPSDFGLPAQGWRFRADASFVRTSRFSPFNAKWKRPELERFVIDPGSVVTFEGDFDVDLEDVRRATAGGVGERLAEGLGEVVAQPEWLEGSEVKLNDVSPSTLRTAVPEPTDELFRWASDQSARRTTAQEAREWARRNARTFRGLRLNRSQWGVMHALARQARYREDADAWLRKSVRRHVTTGVSSLSRGWGQSPQQAEKAGQRLLTLLEQVRSDVPTHLELLAAAALRDLGGGEP